MTTPATTEPLVPSVAQAARWLTVLGTTPDGGIIIGPQGWQKLLEALDRARKRSRGA